jgi:DNA repair exonuclease SbcCD ATPase subunit
MKFRKLIIENYKSFQFPTELHFADGTDGKSIFLIGGMNGAGKTAILEAVNFCLYGGRQDAIFKAVNRKEKARGNVSVSVELEIEMDDFSQLIIKRSWSAGAVDAPKAKDLEERLVVVRDGKRVSIQNKKMWQDFIRATIPPGITQFFFFDGEKIQEIAADDHSEVRLQSSLEAALGIQYINRLSMDVLYLKQEERKGFVEISDEDLEFEDIIRLEKKVQAIEAEIETLYEKHDISRDKAAFIHECDAIAGLLSQYIVRLRKNKIHLLQEKTFEMYKHLSSKSGLIKDIGIDEKTYEVKITDRNGHEIKKSSLSAGEKEVFAVSLLWGLAQTSQLSLPIIVDTPLSRLDSTHRDNIINHYFPNAGEQVVILSTDTEIDTNYYRALKPHLSGAARLEFNQGQELTTIKPGYFWED